MGFQVAWVAIRDVEPTDVLAFYNLASNGENGEYPEALISAVELPNNWYLIHFNDFLPSQIDDEVLLELSKLGHVISCQVHEGMMASVVRSYHAAKKLWSVVHNAQVGIDNLDVSGFVPKAFDNIYEQVEQNYKEDPHGGIDYYFDIPIELARSIVGYRYDYRLQLDDTHPFKSLDDVAAVESVTQPANTTRKKRFVSSYAK